MSEAYGVRPWKYWTGGDETHAGSFSFDLAVLAIGRKEQEEEMKRAAKEK